jgi:REP element-mobilizing transposase RayT
LPGRHSEFDNSGKVRKPRTGELLKAHSKEAFNEGYPKFKPYDMGLQVSSGVDSEMPEKGAVRKQNFTGQHFWARGYYVSTSGRDEEVVRAYIRRQEEFDKKIDQLQMF